MPWLSARMRPSGVPDRTELPEARRTDVPAALGRAAVKGSQRSNQPAGGPTVDSGAFADESRLGQTALRGAGVELDQGSARRDR